jgi:hypothetical protein
MNGIDLVTLILRVPPVSSQSKGATDNNRAKSLRSVTRGLDPRVRGALEMAGSSPAMTEKGS